MSTFIPVKAEEWAKMVEATKVAADLLVENKRLKDELKRLRRAGDAMHKAAVEDSTGLWLLKPFEDWAKAKEQ